uniref:Uncharacterized protein n=1 Tax=Moniliophthora roreri TaxID=221103 RepID=A0A0W0FRQ5_MONRR
MAKSDFDAKVLFKVQREGSLLHFSPLGMRPSYPAAATATRQFHMTVHHREDTGRSPLRFFESQAPLLVAVVLLAQDQVD